MCAPPTQNHYFFLTFSDVFSVLHTFLVTLVVGMVLLILTVGLVTNNQTNKQTDRQTHSHRQDRHTSVRETAKHRQDKDAKSRAWSTSTSWPRHLAHFHLSSGKTSHGVHFAQHRTFLCPEVSSAERWNFRRDARISVGSFAANRPPNATPLPNSSALGISITPGALKLRSETNCKVQNFPMFRSFISRAMDTFCSLDFVMVGQLRFFGNTLQSDYVGGQRLSGDVQGSTVVISPSLRELSKEMKAESERKLSPDVNTVEALM